MDPIATARYTEHLQQQLEHLRQLLNALHDEGVMQPDKLAAIPWTATWSVADAAERLNTDLFEATKDVKPE